MPRPRSRSSSRIDDLSVYNAVQRLLYLGVILVAIVHRAVRASAIWKPVQLQWLTALFGGYDAARYVHFFCMAAIVGFLVVHVLLARDRAEKPARHDHRTLGAAMARIRKLIPGVDPKLLIKDAAKLMPAPTRRVFLRGGAASAR